MIRFFRGFLLFFLSFPMVVFGFTNPESLKSPQSSPLVEDPEAALPPYAIFEVKPVEELQPESFRLPIFRSSRQEDSSVTFWEEQLLEVPSLQVVNQSAVGSIFLEGLPMDKLDFKMEGHSLRDPSLPGGGIEVSSLPHRWISDWQLREALGFSQELNLSIPNRDQDQTQVLLGLGSEPSWLMDLKHFHPRANGQSAFLVGYEAKGGPTQADDPTKSLASSEPDPSQKLSVLFNASEGLGPQGQVSALVYGLKEKQDYDLAGVDTRGLMSERDFWVLGLGWMNRWSHLNSHFRWTEKLGARRADSFASTFTGRTQEVHLSRDSVEKAVQFSLVHEEDEMIEEGGFRGSQAFSTLSFDLAFREALWGHRKSPYAVKNGLPMVRASVKALCELGACEAMGGLGLETNWGQGSKSFIQAYRVLNPASLYQRFSSYGDPSLSREQTLTFRFGMVHDSEFSRTGWGFFKHQGNDYIDFDSQTNRFVNRSRVAFTGGTLFGSQKWFFDEFYLSYSYLEARDLVLSEPLLRRARHQVLFRYQRQSLVCQWGPEFLYKSQLYDRDLSGELLPRPDSMQMHFGAQCPHLRGSWSFQLRNLLQPAISEVDGYLAPQTSLQINYEFAL